jgi:hypothetical protein
MQCASHASLRVRLVSCTVAVFPLSLLLLLHLLQLPL